MILGKSIRVTECRSGKRYITYHRWAALWTFARPSIFLSLHPDPHNYSADIAATLNLSDVRVDLSQIFLQHWQSLKLALMAFLGLMRIKRKHYKSLSFSQNTCPADTFVPFCNIMMKKGLKYYKCVWKKLNDKNVIWNQISYQCRLFVHVLLQTWPRQLCHKLCQWICYRCSIIVEIARNWNRIELATTRWENVEKIHIMAI